MNIINTNYYYYYYSVVIVINKINCDVHVMGFLLHLMKHNTSYCDDSE